MSANIKRIIIVFFLFCKVLFLYGKNSDVTQNNCLPDNIIFTRLLKEEKVRGVNVIEKDNNGFLWFGSSNGLFRFDGYNYKYYSLDGFQSSTVTSLFPTKEGMLVGTVSGLCHINYKGLVTYYPYEIRGRVINYYNGIYYVGSHKGVYLFDNNLKLLDHIEIPNKKKIDRKNIVRTIHIDNKGLVYFGTYDGVYRYNRTTSKCEFIETRSGNIPKNNLVLSFCQVQSEPNKLLVGRETGLTILDINTKEFIELKRANGVDFSNDCIKSIERYGEHCFMLGTDNGLNIWNMKDNSVKSFYHQPDNEYSISDNVIENIYEDNDVAYLATNRGVSQFYINTRLNVRKLDYKTDKLYENISCIASDKTSNIYVGTVNGLLKFHNNKLEKLYTVEDGLEHNNLNVLFVDKDNVTWLGTMNGINYISNDNVYSAGCDIKYIRNIFQTDDGALWAVNNKFLYPIKKKGHKYIANERIQPEVMNEESFQIRESICIGNNIYLYSNVGLYEYNSKTDVFTNLDVKITTTWNSTIASYGNKIIYTSSNYLNIYDRLLKTTQKVELSNKIKNISKIISHNDDIWIFSDKFLLKYNVLTSEKSVYDYVRDLPFHGELPNAICCSANHLYLGSYGTCLVLDMDNINKFSCNTPVKIISIKVNNKEVESFDDELNLSHKQNNIEISFSLLNYTNVTNNSYRCNLKGKKDDIVVLEKGDNNIFYSNLSPGEYEFKVEGIDADTEISPYYDVIKIHIDKPWWAKTWAFAIYFFIFCLFVALIIFIIDKRVAVLEKRQTKKLRIQNIRKLNNMRMKFFMNISHEFKTPLSLILGPVESLIDKCNDSSDLSQLKIISRNVSRLKQLVNQIMSLNTIVKGESQMTPMMGDLVMFSKNIVEDFSIKAKNKGIKIEFESEFDYISTLFDESKMEEVFYNLLDNAIKFTSEGGTIFIYLSEDKTKLDTEDEGKRVKIIIRDTGIGLYEHELAHLFERFYQAENNNVVDGKGSGIGLNIVKEFVELHGGKISVSSEHGVGTSFEIILPVLSFNSLSSSEDSTSKVSNETVSENEEIPTIVLVEDNPDMRKFIVLNLEQDYNIIEAENGIIGWQMIQTCVPDIIITDILMPKMDGINLCKHVRTEFKTEHIPVIVLTALSEKTSLKEALEAGANSFVTKPFSIKTLKLKIESILTDRKRVRNKFKILALQKPAEVEKEESRDEKLIKEFVKIVEDNIDNSDLNVDFICENLGYSHSHIYRKIQAITGKTINGMIRYVRIHRAAQLLVNTDMTLVEILYSVGMSNRTYFNRIFKEEFGKTPTEYRKQHFS